MLFGSSRVHGAVSHLSLISNLILSVGTELVTYPNQGTVGGNISQLAIVER